MTPTEYATYRDFIASDDSCDHDARQETDRLLPSGPSTTGHHLFSIKSAGVHVGIIWMTTKDRKSGSEAFVLDLVIFPPFRRRGYARMAISLAEHLAVQMGLSQMSLSVSAQNLAALTLYQASGFAPVFTRMSKKLKRPNKAPEPTPTAVTPRATE